MKSGLQLIAKERKEQIEKHGHTLKDVQKYVNNDLQYFAAWLIFSDQDYIPKSWDHDYVQSMLQKPRIGRLAIAAAFMVAEIDMCISDKENLTQKDLDYLKSITESTKHFKIDYHSLYLSEREVVTVIQKKINYKGEFGEKTFQAFFMGMKQIDTCSPWNYVFAIKNEDGSILIKYIPPHEIKEISHTINMSEQPMLNGGKEN